MAIITFENYTYRVTEEEEEYLIPAICEIFNHLKPGQFITNREIQQSIWLMAGWGAITPARIRVLIHIIRVTDRVPLLIAGQKGYFISYDPDLVRIYIHSLEERIERVERTRDAIERQWGHATTEIKLIINNQKP